jgi:predicted metalloprotease with PDZ domain
MPISNSVRALPAVIAAVLATLLSCAALAAPAPLAPATLEVDAREAPRGVERAHLVLPVKPGKLTLLYPKWLPGEHQANGPVGSLAELRFSVAGKPLAWQRDSVDMFAFHLTVPPGAASLEVSFEVDATQAGAAPNALRTTTESTAIIHWNELVFYPAGVQSDDMQIAAKLRLPAGWSLGTALPHAGTSGDTSQFAPVSLTTLVDSPVLAGRHFRTVELGGAPAVSMHLAADGDAALGISEKQITHFRQLVQETVALFGATHYNEYHFLWSLSDTIGFEGIEHHQSSDDRSPERSLIDDELQHSGRIATLLSHEYVHSWNGKFRRPAGLATGNYDSPMRGDLLWVYEGLTEYLGQVLAARSGLYSSTDAREDWADVAARLQLRKGRDWRSLADTATGAPIGYSQAVQWRERTRDVDFYEESAMLWLEADVLIRTKSGGNRSLDDFCKLFYGPPSTAPKVVPYEFADVIKALNTVLPYDWRAFWTERLNRLQADAPLQGLTTAGWLLRFDAEESAEAKANDASRKRNDFLFSLGFSLTEEGAIITELVPGSPADLAGMSPDSRLIAVDGRKYSKDVLEDALKTGGDEARIIKLLMQKDDSFMTLDVRYAGHARFPHMERNTAVPDTLSEILNPHTQ